MSAVKKKTPNVSKAGGADRIALAAIGLEAEFAVVMNGEQVRPEDVFGSPRESISGQRLHLGGQCYTPVGMKGWSRVVFKRLGDRTRHVFPLDFS